MKCTCEEWKPNVEKVNAPFVFLNARNPVTDGGYKGVQFRFCPWCGSALIPEHARERVAVTQSE